MTPTRGKATPDRDASKAARKKAKREARRLWKKLPPAPASHPYLVRKGIGVGPCRLTPKGLLVVPVRDATTDKLMSVQYINPDGTKKYPKNAQKKGGCCVLGNLDSADPLVIAEGYATGASIHEATGWPTLVAFDCGNLPPVAEALRERFPKRDIIIAADNDLKTAGNPGVTKATEAARLIKARLAIPTLSGDFNDLATAKGLGAIRQIVEAAQRPKKPPMLSRQSPYKSAQVFVARDFTASGTRTLHFHSGGFFRWLTTNWPEIEPGEMRARLYTFLEDAVVLSKKDIVIPFDPNTTRISNVVDALKAYVHLNKNFEPPCWLDNGPRSPDPLHLIPCRNGLLEIPSRKLWPLSPLFFNVGAIDLDYDPDAPTPKLWKRFLRDLWGDDNESKRCLQEIFGYMLTPNTGQQKIFLLVGPKRSGKGVTGRVLMGLLGKQNVTSPTLSSLGTNFGLSPLIHKRAAIISDARLGGRADQYVVAERLLSVSGEDSITVDRKFRDPWTGRLGVRFLILANELPRIADASGALTSRFVLLTLEKSFYGREDLRLTEKLLTELPGILNWALRGLDRLRERGYFKIPKASRDAIQTLEDLGSPVAAFLREECETGAGKRCLCTDVFIAWRSWCDEQGQSRPGTAQTFGRDLRAALPSVRTRQKAGGRRFYEGVALKETEHEPGWDDS